MVPVSDRQPRPERLAFSNFDLWPILVGFYAVSACGLAAGLSLNFFLGLLALSAVLLPPLTLRAMLFETGRRPLWGLHGFLLLACGAAVIQQRVALLPAAECFAVLASFAAVLIAAARLLHAARLPAAPAAAAITIVAMLWLAAPLWACRNPGEAVALWTPIHPVFAINKALLALGVWTEQPLTYQLTPLGQDVAYALPSSVLPCIAVHIAAAGCLIGFATVVRKWRA